MPSRATPKKANPQAKPAKSTGKQSAPTKSVKSAVSKPQSSGKPAAKAAAAKVGAGKAAAPKSVKAAAKPSSPPAAKKPAAPVKKTSAKVPATGPLDETLLRQMSDDDYMNDRQLAFFRERLLVMRKEVLAREVDAKNRLNQREVFADPADRATAEEEHWLDLRLRERESLLLRKIDEALKRIADREYGYCEKTGDPIGIPRLLARPTATVCVDIKGQDERVEAQFRDR
jgi:DnaK suppressor protein